jgi:hypothetical protein
MISGIDLEEMAARRRSQYRSASGQNIWSLPLAMGGFGVPLFRPSFLVGIAFVGILLGMCGAAILYWETNLVPDEVTKITNVIMAAGDSRSLNRRERHSLLVVSLESGIFGVLIGLLSFRVYQGSPNRWRFAVELEVSVLCALMPPTTYYAAMKWARLWFHRQAETLGRFNQRPAQRLLIIRSWLRLLGFVALWLAGLLQLPALLWRH